jgi:hypothetical protein
VILYQDEKPDRYLYVAARVTLSPSMVVITVADNRREVKGLSGVMHVRFCQCICLYMYSTITYESDGTTCVRDVEADTCP